MERTLTTEIASLVDQTAHVRGWVERVRHLGQVSFILLRDRNGYVQVVLETSQLVMMGAELTSEAVVAVTGTVRADPRATGGCEIWADQIEVLSPAEPLPFTLHAPTLKCHLDTQLEHRSLSLRHRSTQPVFQVQSSLVDGFGHYLRQQGFTQVFTPKIVGYGTEGGTELFSLQYFDQKAYLAQSPQFYKQTLVASGFERVFEIAPVYRAEHHATSRHLNEYISLDLEMAFIEDEQELMDLETRLLAAMIERVSSSHPSLDLPLPLPQVPNKIPTIPVAEAQAILRKHFDRTFADDELDLDPEAERQICAFAQKQWGSEFVFLTEYPKAKRPMYTMPKGDSGTASFDLLFRGTEITTGGQRIHCHTQLCQAIEEAGLDPRSYDSYLNAFRYGMPPHGGLAIGLERLTALLTGRHNVREASLFPRDRWRLKP